MSEQIKRLNKSFQEISRKEICTWTLAPSVIICVECGNSFNFDSTPTTVTRPCKHQLKLFKEIEKEWRKDEALQNLSNISPERI
jgi:hypothetical protein